MIAIVVALLVWSSPAPALWVCNPGKSPRSAPSNCERIHFSVLAKFPSFSQRLDLRR